MTYTVVLLLTRKPNISPEQFKEYYENNHLPLVKLVFGPLCPVPKRRFYLARADSDESEILANTRYPPQMLKGHPEDIDFDCITELSWEDEKTFKEFQQMMMQPEVMAKIAADHEHFMGEERVMVIGEVLDSLPSGWS